MQRKIIPDAENRLLILYALKTVGAMTDQQLLIVMTDTDLMNYITLQLTIADLESEGKLRRQGDTSGWTLELTDAGRYLLNSFEMHIPVSRRGLIDSGAAQWRERFAAEQMAAVEIFDLPNGEKGLHLRIVDRRNVLLDITFALPTGKRINCLQQRWQQCMNQVYLLLLSTLGSGHTPEKKLPDGCSVLQVSDSEWLTTACDNPTQPTITLMVSLPTEETAHECAAAFPTMSAVVRDAILALLDGAQLP